MATKITDLDRALAEGGIETETQLPPATDEPIYKVSADSRVPVAKSTGKLWKTRRDQALSARKRKGLEQAWDEAIQYYKNDQMKGRNLGTEGNVNRSTAHASRLTDEYSETENVVFANIGSLVPALYSKNPSVEVTLNNPMPTDEERAYGTLVERFANALANRVTKPGVNLKPIIRRSVSMASLTNRAVVYTSYVMKGQSDENAHRELIRLSDELKKAKDSKEIKEIEGKLQALEHTISFLSPSGPDVRSLHPKQVLVDPDAEQPGRMDAKWMMHYEFISTEFIKAVYGSRDKNKDARASIYKPTHVLRLGEEATTEADEVVNNFTLIDEGSDHKKYGFADEESYCAAQRTKVWYVWDKTTRRVLLFNDKDWSWPIWVWDDPLNLDSFFPYDFLEFYTDPEDNDAKGEVTYYLDQQDAINEINDEERRARRWARFKIMYNKRLISHEDAMKYVKGVDGTAVGIDIDPEVALNQAVFSAPPPSLQFAKLFDKTSKYQAIDRISSMNEIGRGGEYKTNTTNRAIEQYQSVSGVRLEEKVDAIEDFIGSIMWKVLQLCMMNMSPEEVARIIGPSAKMWRQMQAQEISASFSARIVGGSTQKPTSQVKKREAIELGQVLGQFARITPAAAVVAIQVMERAFDEITIKEEDWAAIRQSMSQGPGGGEGEQILGQIDQLPPQAKEALGKAITRGVPMQQALSQIVQAIEQVSKGSQTNAD